MTIDRERTVGELAVEYPLATRVFARHGIDFCCGGGKPLGEVCEAKQLEPEKLLEEIRHELAKGESEPERWGEAPIDDLVEHTLFAYHRPLDEELPRLEAMARKVFKVHHEKDEATLSEVLSVYLGLKAELEQHMAKEEQILFPMIKQGQGAMADGPIAVMLEEHDGAGAALARLRSLTKDFEPPAEACNTWRALWAGLADLEKSLHQHIHLENNILFPRVLDS